MEIITKQNTVMTVKEVFELRKQGRIEEAYDTIRPMYRVHHGHYTTICMFWTASDVLKLRLEQKRNDEAVKIFQSLVRLYPTMADDKELRGHKQLLFHAMSLSECVPTFSMIDFMENGGLQSLTPDDWKAGASNGHPLPSLASQLISDVHHELDANPTPELALRCVPILREALSHNRNNMNFLRLMALIHRITGETAKAVDIYKQLLRRHNQSYLYSELAALSVNPQNKIPLLCKALLTQREEKFRTKLHIQLAELLLDVNPPVAAYNLQESIRLRQAGGFHVSQQQLQLQQRLDHIQPASSQDALAYHQQQSARVEQIVLASSPTRP